MSEKSKLRQVKVKKKKKDEYKLGFNWFFWICFVIICIPVGYFLWLLLQASQESNTPIVGDRLTNDIRTQITENQIASVQSGCAGIDGVEKCEVNLAVATLRISIDGRDGMSEDEYKSVCMAIYEEVDGILPVSEYFTGDDEYKQYDLEINLYDDLEKEEPITMILLKNATMEEYEIIVTSTPKDASLAQQLLEEAAADDTAAEEPASEESTGENAN